MSRADAELLLDRRAERTELGASVSYGVSVDQAIVTHCGIDTLLIEAERHGGFPVAIVDGCDVPLTRPEFERAQRAFLENA